MKKVQLIAVFGFLTLSAGLMGCGGAEQDNDVDTGGDAGGPSSTGGPFIAADNEDFHSDTLPRPGRRIVPPTMDTPVPPAPPQLPNTINWEHMNDLGAELPQPPPPAPSGPGALDPNLSINHDALAADGGEARECFIHVPGHEGIRTPC